MSGKNKKGGRRGKRGQGAPPSGGPPLVTQAHGSPEQQLVTRGVYAMTGVTIANMFFEKASELVEKVVVWLRHMGVL